MASLHGNGIVLKLNGANPIYNVPVPAGGPGNVLTAKPFLKWDTANLVISRIMFEAELLDSTNVGDSEVQYSWPGPKLVDLLTLTNSTFTIPAPPGKYKEIEFKIYANKSDAGSNPVFYLSGTYTNTAGNKIPIIIDITDNIVLKAEKDNVTISVGLGTSGSLSGLIQVYLDRLFSSILPQNLEVMGVNTRKIIISSTSYPDLYQLILQNLAKNGQIEFGH